MFNKNWELKKLSKNVTNNKINKIYNFALKMGQLVGKLLEQGQVVFIFYVQEKNENFLKNELLKQIRFKPEYEGSRFI